MSKSTVLIVVILIAIPLIYSQAKMYHNSALVHQKLAILESQVNQNRELISDNNKSNSGHNELHQTYLNDTASDDQDFENSVSSIYELLKDQDFRLRQLEAYIDQFGMAAVENTDQEEKSSGDQIEQGDLLTLTVRNYELETTNIQWTMGIDAELSQAFDNNKELEGGALSGVECRATRCKIDVVINPDTIDDERFFFDNALFSELGNAGLSSGVLDSSTDVDGILRVTIYAEPSKEQVIEKKEN